MKLIWKKYEKNNRQDYKKLMQDLKGEFPDCAINLVLGLCTPDGSERSGDIYVLFDWNKPLLWIKHTKDYFGYSIGVNDEHLYKADPKYLGLVIPKIKGLDEEKRYVEELEKDKRDYETLVKLKKKKILTDSELILVYSLYSKFDLAKDIIEGKTKHHTEKRNIREDYMKCNPRLQADFIVASMKFGNKSLNVCDEKPLIEACLKTDFKALDCASCSLLYNEQFILELISSFKTVESEHTRYLIIDNLLKYLPNDYFNNVNFLCKAFVDIPDLLHHLGYYEERRETKEIVYWPRNKEKYDLFMSLMSDLNNQSILLDSLLEGLVSAEIPQNKDHLVEQIVYYFDANLVWQKVYSFSHKDMHLAQKIRQRIRF